jgi:hypothetical protein
MLHFIRQQEERLAMRLLAWQYQKNEMALPPPSELARQAAKLVDDAHRIARERGSNVVAIIKDLVADIRRP